MTKSTRAATLAASCVLISVAGMSLTARADDGSRLIWSPSKTGDNAITMRMGLRLPSSMDVSTGADVAVSATKGGRVSGGVPINLWGKVTTDFGRKSAIVARRTVSLQVRAGAVASSVMVETSRNRILTPQVDFETRRSLAVRCNRTERHCAEFDAAQSARLVFPLSATAVVAEGSFSSGSLDLSNSLAVEQKLLPNLNLRASVAQPVSKPRGAVSVNYAFSW